MAIFFASPIGLGHATRDLAIAAQLKTDLLFVSGEEAAKLLAKSYYTLDVYRPEKFIVKSGQLQPSFRWLMNYYSYYKKCKEFARDILAKHDGLIISDEDFASIAVSEDMHRKRV